MSRGADAKANAYGWQAHLSEVSAAAEGSNLLSTIAPGTPTPLLNRLSSVILLSRKETSGIPQKSVIMACSSTTLARWSAASPVISLEQRLRGARAQSNGMRSTVRGWAGEVREVGCHRVSAFLVSGR